MACFGRNTCANDNYDCDMHMNVVSGATDEQNGCGCNCCCCCGCGCNNCGTVGGANTNCGVGHYVTTAQCDCEEVEEETTCGCNACNTNTCGCNICG